MARTTAKSIRSKPVGRTGTSGTSRGSAPTLHWSDLVLRAAMLGVSVGSIAQMLGYSDLGHALMAIGGACGANAHLKDATP